MKILETPTLWSRGAVRRLLSAAFLLCGLNGFAQLELLNGVINAYAAVVDYDPCYKDSLRSSWLDVDDPSPFAPQDSVLIIQMKGATTLWGSNNNGNVNDPKSSGLAERQRIRSIVGNRIYLDKELVHRYDRPTLGSVQLVKMKCVMNARTTGDITCPPWDGQKGGVIHLSVSGYFLMYNNFVADGKGFRGGPVYSIWLNPYTCGTLTEDGHAGDPLLAYKGEGIASCASWPSCGSESTGMAKNANGGGGGNNHNAGGGGGSNFGVGGKGGLEFSLCPPVGGSNLDNGGRGGASTTAWRLYMGGGGGAGHSNDNRGTSGANGGGIVIVHANWFIAPSLGLKITASGANAATSGNDGAGGGGGGGTVSVCANYVFGNPVTLLTEGGFGGNVNDPNFSYGPGGGGGGGYIYHSGQTQFSTTFPMVSIANNGTDMLSGGGNGAYWGDPSLKTPTCLEIPKGWTSYCERDTVEVTFCPNQSGQICFDVCSDVLGVLVGGLDAGVVYTKDAEDTVCIDYTSGWEDDIFYAEFVKVPESCPSGRWIKVNVSPVQRDTIHLVAHCGDMIDLSLYDTICNLPNLGWENVTAGESLLDPVFSARWSGFYRKLGFEDSTYDCLRCITYVDLVVLPMEPDTVTVLGCEGGYVDLDAPWCSDADIYVWTDPQGQGSTSFSPHKSVVAHGGDTWVMRGYLPNGCICITYFVMETQVPINLSLGMTINCGDPFDLQDYAATFCNGGSYFVLDMDQQIALIGSPPTNVVGTTNYTIHCFSDSAYNCLTTILDLQLNIIPLPPDTIDVYACEGAMVTISPSPNCQPAFGYNYESASYLGFSTTDPNQQFIANDGDQHLITAFMPNGCECRTVVNVHTVPRIELAVEATVVCGSTVDLNRYVNGCLGGAWYAWEDEFGNPVPDPTNVLINGTMSFTLISYNADGCEICRQTITFHSTEAPPVHSTYLIDCTGDGNWVTPQFCNYPPVEVYNDQNVLVGAGGFVAQRNDAGKSYTFRSVGPDGCPCTEIITLDTITPSRVEHSINLEVNCGDVVDLNQYTGCSGAYGDWIPGLGDPPAQGGIFTADSSTHNVSYYRSVTNATLCTECVESVTITVHHNPGGVTVDPVIHYFCQGGAFDPDPPCEGDHYVWKDENDDQIVSNERGLLIDPSLNGTRFRYTYDANNCLKCIELFHLVWADPLTEQDVENTPVNVFTFDMCQGSVLLTPLPQNWADPMGTSCIWSPYDPTDGMGNFAVGPAEDGITFTRRCYSEDGCLIQAYRVRFEGTPCEQGKAAMGATNEAAGDSAALRLMPNPNNGQFYLESAKPLTENDLMLFDALGRQIPIQLQRSGDFRYEVQVEGALPGIYFLRVNLPFAQQVFKVSIQP